MNNIKFTKGKCFSRPGKIINEDICLLKDSYAWVIDGASGLTSSKITHGESDAKWFALEWDDYLKENIIKEKSLQEIVENGIGEIKNKFFCFNGAEGAAKIEQPSASIIIVRFMGEKMEYFALGDCTLLCEKADGEVMRVWDNTVSMLDSKVISTMYSMHKEQNIPMLDARACVKDMLQSHREMKNTDKGYWILGMEKEAVHHGLSGRLNINDIHKVCMFSDGFAQYYDTLKLCSDYKEFLYKVSNSDLVRLYEELWQAQEEDKEFDRFPRLKIRDDASIVYFETPSRK